MKLLSLAVALLLTATSLWAAGAKPAPVRTLYLVRHGAYAANEKGDDASALTALGIAQARLVAARLRGMPVTFDAIYHSTMLRAKQTAGEIHASLPEVPLEGVDLLRECTPPTWRADIMKRESPEQLAAAQQQLDSAFARFFVPATDRDRHDVLVCHGNVIRYLVTKALGVDTHAWLNFTIAHCSLTVIQVSADGKFKVLAVGDIGHVPPNLQSGATSAAWPELVTR